MTTHVAKNSREKYSEIRITWWEVVSYPFNSGPQEYWKFRWWLEDNISFSVGDEAIKVPLDTQGEDIRIVPKGFFTSNEIELDIRHENWDAQRFPVKGDYTSFNTRRSRAFIFGEEDNILISAEEFYNAGGSMVIDWDSEEYRYYINIQPPLENIGVNKSFSTSLEGSVPAIFIQSEGYTLKKRVSTLYTEFYGKIHNVLEQEYDYITSKEQLYYAAQRLLEKYSYGNTSFNLDYWGNSPTIVDNKQFIPQTVTIDSTGRRTTNNAFIYNSLDSIPEKPLSELGSSEHTLDDVQFYPLAFLS